ncbi:MAG: hypothetical protein ABUR63_01330 [Verrucomicrobiota bacterium]
MGTSTADTKNIRAWSTQDKIAEAIRRSVPLLPGGAKAAVVAMLQPEAMAMVAGTLALWAASHLFGVGEIADIVLLGVGAVLLGTSVFKLGDELWAFGKTAIGAASEADLDGAARHFARAVLIAGIDVVSALLLRKNLRAVVRRGRPTVEPGLERVGRAPRGAGAFYRPIISRPATLPGGALGETDWYGNIAVTRTQSVIEQRLTLYHEWVHSVLSPRLRPLQELRASVRAAGYWRSALLRYLEEALAESYAQLRVRGLGHVWRGVTFPVGPAGQSYVTVGELMGEGAAIGSIMVGGMVLRVVIVRGDLEGDMLSCR